MTAPQETPAPAWSVRLAFELSANDQTSQALAARLTEDQLNWQPAPGSWSVGQCLEHLCKTNEAYLASISGALKEKPDSPVEQITPGWFGRWFIRSFVEPSPNSKRVSAPPKIRPAARVDVAVLDRFPIRQQIVPRTHRPNPQQGLKPHSVLESFCGGNSIHGWDWTGDHYRPRTSSFTAGGTSPGFGELSALVNPVIADNCLGEHAVCSF